MHCPKRNSASQKTPVQITNYGPQLIRKRKCVTVEIGYSHLTLKVICAKHAVKYPCACRRIPPEISDVGDDQVVLKTVRSQSQFKLNTMSGLTVLKVLKREGDCVGYL